MMTTMISRFCLDIVLTLATALAQDVAFFREYGTGPEQPSELANDNTGYHVVGEALPSYSAIPGVATPGFLRKVDAAGNEVRVRRFSPSTLVLRRYGVATYSGPVYVAGYTGGRRRSCSSVRQDRSSERRSVRSHRGGAVKAEEG
jgi:hypothetical protein